MTPGYRLHAYMGYYFYNFHGAAHIPLIQNESYPQIFEKRKK